MSLSEMPRSRSPASGLLLVVELDERGAVVEGDEERRVGDGDLDAALAEAQLGDHELVENADDVGAGADDVALVGEWPLERAGAADALAPLEHEDALALARQVRGCGQPVVAPADDDDVPVARRELGDGAGKAELAELLGDGVQVAPSASAEKCRLCAALRALAEGITSTAK